MFEQLQDRFGTIFRNLRGLGKITEKNAQETGRQIRRALLEADVNYKVAKDFVDTVIQKAKGSVIVKSISPGQQFIKIIRDELAKLLGEHNEPLRLSKNQTTVILMAGLQGSGKTTTAAKLAKHLKSEGKRPYLVAADVYRPAAVEQLQILGKQIEVPVWSEDHRDPVKICSTGVAEAKASNHNVVILDSAGRLHVDSEMMEEIIEIARETNPDEVLFVVDGMTGQDAVNSAEAFSAALNITGTVLTKMDGDARGGAAVSITAITKTPIKFIGTSERIDGLEAFHPERMANRILGMGDIVTLVERAEKVVDKEQVEKITKKLRREEFTLEDFQVQLAQVRKMGSFQDVVSMIPGLGNMAKGMNFDEQKLVWMNAIINSMTEEERTNPSLINGGRRKRIAKGSGRTVQEVNRLLKEFYQLQKVMKNFSKMKINKSMLNQFTGVFN